MWQYQLPKQRLIPIQAPQILFVLKGKNRKFFILKKWQMQLRMCRGVFSPAMMFCLAKLKPSGVWKPGNKKLRCTLVPTTFNVPTMYVTHVKSAFADNTELSGNCCYNSVLYAIPGLFHTWFCLGLDSKLRNKSHPLCVARMFANSWCKQLDMAPSHLYPKSSSLVFISRCTQFHSGYGEDIFKKSNASVVGGNTCS